MKKRFFTSMAVAAVLMMFVYAMPALAEENNWKNNPTRTGRKIVYAMPALAEENNYISNKVGVGYQGMIAGDYLNGISVRGWVGNNFGLEASFFYGGIDAEVDGHNATDSDVFLTEVKAMYALLVKKNSRFYVGAKGGYGKLDIEVIDEEITDDDLWSCGAFVGSEWNFQGIPELGFNFDVGYNYMNYDDDHIDIDLDGIAVTFGIHYYF